MIKPVLEDRVDEEVDDALIRDMVKSSMRLSGVVGPAASDPANLQCEATVNEMYGIIGNGVDVESTGLLDPTSGIYDELERKVSWTS